MDWDRHASDATGQQAEPRPAEVRNLISAAPAQVTDVLFDQLQYLVEHSEGNCSAACRDCRRLQMVTDWLLLPFRSRNRV